MGLLDALLSNDSGGGLFGGLPSYWQYKNPQDDLDQKAFMAGLSQDPSMGNNVVAPQSPFGPIPSFAQQPQSVFAGGAAPITPNFNPALLTPQQPPMQAPQAPPMVPQPAPQIAQDQPTNTLNVGGYQMPQFGSPQMAQPQATDISAQSRAPAEPMALPPALQDRSLLSRIGSPDGLIARLTGTDSRSVSQQTLRATYDATREVLRQSGMSDREASSKAMLAVLNPEAGKTILPEALTTKEKFHTLKDSFGNETPAFVNERDQTINGKPINAQGTTDSGGSGVQQLSDKIATMRAQGATESDLLNEVPSMYRGYVKSLIEGQALPTNIGRSQARGALMTLAHAVNDHFDESLIPQRMTYARGIGDTKSSSAPGGQRQAINTATGHFADLAEALVAQNNANGGVLSSLPGSGPLATGYNAVANSSSKNSENSAKILQEADSTAGEMGKLYSGSQGGGVHEREATKSRYSPNLPPLQAAGALQATRDLLLEKIRSNEAARDQAFGPDAKARIDFMDDSVKKNLARVDAAIAQLKGGTSQGPSALPSGWSVKVR